MLLGRTSSRSSTSYRLPSYPAARGGFLDCLREGQESHAQEICKQGCLGCACLPVCRAYVQMSTSYFRVLMEFSTTREDAQKLSSGKPHDRGGGVEQGTHRSSARHIRYVRRIPKFQIFASKRSGHDSLVLLALRYFDMHFVFSRFLPQVSQLVPRQSVVSRAVLIFLPGASSDNVVLCSTHMSPAKKLFALCVPLQCLRTPASFFTTYTGHWTWTRRYSMDISFPNAISRRIPYHTGFCCQWFLPDENELLLFLMPSRTGAYCFAA